MLRVGAVSASPSSRPSRSQRVAGQGGRRRRSSSFDCSEGGDKIYLRYDKPVEPDELANSLKAHRRQHDAVQRFGRADDHTYEVTLVGLDIEIRRRARRARWARAR